MVNCLMISTFHFSCTYSRFELLPCMFIPGPLNHQNNRFREDCRLLVTLHYSFIEILCIVEFESIRIIPFLSIDDGGVGRDKLHWFLHLAWGRNGHAPSWCFHTAVHANNYDLQRDRWTSAIHYLLDMKVTLWTTNAGPTSLTNSYERHRPRTDDLRAEVE